MSDNKHVLCLEELSYYTELMKKYAEDVSSSVNVGDIYSVRSTCTFNDGGNLAIACIQLPIHVDSSKILLQSVTVQGGKVDYKDNFSIQTNDDELGFIIVCSDMQVLKRTIGKTLNISFKIS